MMCSTDRQGQWSTIRKLEPIQSHILQKIWPCLQLLTQLLVKRKYRSRGEQELEFNQIPTMCQTHHSLVLPNNSVKLELLFLFHGGEERGSVRPSNLPKIIQKVEEVAFEPQSDNQKPRLFLLIRGFWILWLWLIVRNAFTYYYTQIHKCPQLNKSFMNQYLPLKYTVHSAISYRNL